MGPKWYHEFGPGPNWYGSEFVGSELPDTPRIRLRRQKSKNVASIQFIQVSIFLSKDTLLVNSTPYYNEIYRFHLTFSIFSWLHLAVFDLALNRSDISLNIFQSCIIAQVQLFQLSQLSKQIWDLS